MLAFELFSQVLIYTYKQKKQYQMYIYIHTQPINIELQQTMTYSYPLVLSKIVWASEISFGVEPKTQKTHDIQDGKQTTKTKHIKTGMNLN